MFKFIILIAFLFVCCYKVEYSGTLSEKGKVASAISSSSSASNYNEIIRKCVVVEPLPVINNEAMYSM